MSTKKHKPYLHQVNDVVLFQGKRHKVHSRRYVGQKKQYRLYSREGDSIILKAGQSTTWLNEYNLMKLYPEFEH